MVNEIQREKNRIKAKKYYYKNRERIALESKKRYLENIEFYRLKSHKQHIKDREKNRARANAWYYANREEALKKSRIWAKSQSGIKSQEEAGKRYRLKYKDVIRKRLKEWYKNNKQYAKNKAKQWKLNHPEKNNFNRYCSISRCKLLSKFGMSYEEFIEFVKRPCIYCGFNNGYVGIDRVDSSLGYVKGNMVPCCSVCNYMKLDHSVEDWLSSMKDVFNNLGFEVKQIK